MSDFLRISELVLYNNHHLVAFAKPGGIPVQPDQTGDPSLLAMGSSYCQTPLHLIHRLDRPVSGVVLFAKRPGALQHLHQQFRDRTVSKSYLAVVAQAPPAPEGELLHYLAKGKGHRSLAYDEPREGAIEARLRYRTVGQSDRFFLLEIELLTGRYHQIRSQLAHIGCPIRGDAKYGYRRRNPDRSIDLHAWQLQFDHPVSNERETLIAPPPSNPLWDALTEGLVNPE